MNGYRVQHPKQSANRQYNRLERVLEEMVRSPERKGHESTIPRSSLQYQLKGRQDMGQPSRRWKGQEQLEFQRKGY